MNAPQILLVPWVVASLLAQIKIICEGTSMGLPVQAIGVEEDFYQLSQWERVGVTFHLECGLVLFSGTLTD